MYTLGSAVIVPHIFLSPFNKNGYITYTKSVIKNTTLCTPSIFVWFVYDSEQTANISLYGITVFDNRDGERLLRGKTWFIYNSG